MAVNETKCIPSLTGGLYMGCICSDIDENVPPRDRQIHGSSEGDDLITQLSHVIVHRLMVGNGKQHL